MFKVLEPHCEPKRGTKYSAYVDLFAREDDEDVAIAQLETLHNQIYTKMGELTMKGDK